MSKDWEEPHEVEMVKIMHQATPKIMNNKLTIGSFKREGIPGSFQHYFSHKMEDGREVCLEACYSGYCVGIFDASQNIIGEKTCTSIEGYSDAQIAPGFSAMNSEALEKAVQIANEKLGL